MKMNDMVLVSVDDHITEPGTVFDKQLSGQAKATAPTLKVKQDGANYWEYQGKKIQSVALNAVTGRVREEYGMEPTALEQLRKGCWDVDARVDDMNINGIAASLNFPSFAGIEGGLFIGAPDKSLALVHMRAYNDWHIDEWCGAHPGRFIPLGILPLWDPQETAKEVKRLANKGCHAVSMSENPTKRNLPSIHSGYYEPLWQALVENDTAVCPAHRDRQPCTALLTGVAHRGQHYHHADGGRVWCGRLVESGCAAALSEDENLPV
jgi:predicted TIM-barrel fold metal-dependent hydrolase